MLLIWCKNNTNLLFLPIINESSRECSAAADYLIRMAKDFPSNSMETLLLEEPSRVWRISSLVLFRDLIFLD